MATFVYPFRVIYVSQLVRFARIYNTVFRSMSYYYFIFNSLF